MRESAIAQVWAADIRRSTPNRKPGLC